MSDEIVERHRPDGHFYLSALKICNTTDVWEKALSTEIVNVQWTDMITNQRQPCESSEFI
jgi:hypothetical protein